MKLLKIALALALTLILPGLAHALTLRTAPFPGLFINSGRARCAVTNGSNRESDRAVVTILSSAAILNTNGPFILPPGTTAFGESSDLELTSPTWCQCEVPNRQHTCSFIYNNGTIVEVIRAE